jgi:hypothetical protein
MTYPPALYTGDGGLVNATLRPDGSKPELDLASMGAAHYLATGDSTGGKFGLYRWEMGADPTGPAPHFHRSITESFLRAVGGGAALQRDRLADRPG